MLPVGLTRRGLWLMPVVGAYLLWRTRPAIRSLKPLDLSPGMSVRMAHLISPLWLETTTAWAIGARNPSEERLSGKIGIQAAREQAVLIFE
jgi:hypothetical protein